MTILYEKAKNYLAATKEYYAEHKKQKEYNPKLFTGKLKELYDALPDFEEHFNKDIYEPHGIFSAKVGDVEIYILYGHEQIRVITPNKTINESTR